MALPINNTLTSKAGLVPRLNTGTQTSTPAVASQGAPAPQGMVFPVGANMSPSSTQNAFNTLRGLVTPNLGSLGSTPVINHTITISPDQTVTQKVTHAPVAQPTQENSAVGGNTNITAPQNSAPSQFTTPSGAIVRADGTVVSAPQDQLSFPSLVGQQVSTANQNQAVGAHAGQIADEFSKEIQQAQQDAALREHALMTGSGASAPLQGTALAQAQLGANQVQALQGAEQAALAGTGQQLTAQQQQQAGLNSAATLAQPQFNPSTLSFFNPLTASASVPQPTTYTVQAGDTLNTIAARNGIPVEQLEAANPQITDVNKIDVGQQISLPPAGGQFGTGPAAAANVASIGALQTQVNSMSAARSAVNSVVQNQLTPFLQSNNVNPSDINAVNAFIQTVARNTSSPQYKELSNLLTDIAQSYSPVFVAQGQDPSVWVSQTTQGLLDGTAKGETISNIISSLDAQAKSKIDGYQATINALQHGQNVNPAPTSSNNSSNASSGASSASFSKGQTAAGGQLMWNGSQWVVNS